VGEARRQADGALISNGGRVVHVVGRGHSMPEARQNAYENIGMLWFEGMRYRHDIGAVMPWEYFP
jgi:phosphoribosylamine--glycine ligase